MKANYEEDKVIVSTTEPTGLNRKKVWFKKGKNLFDKNAVILKEELTNGIPTANDDWYVSDYISVDSNTNYVKSGDITEGTAICFYDINKQYIDKINILNGNFVTGADCKYVRINGLIAELNNNIMIEQNPTVTAYEAYVEPEIYILNSNNVYEKFEKDENKEKILFEGSVKFGNDVCVIPDNIRYVEVYFKIGNNKNSIRIDTSYTPTSTECIGTFIACTGTNFAEVEMNFKANRYLKADYIAIYANLNSDAVNKNNTDGFEVYKVVGYK